MRCSEGIFAAPLPWEGGLALADPALRVMGQREAKDPWLSCEEEARMCGVVILAALSKQMWWGRGDSVKGQGVPAWNLSVFFLL